MALAPTAIPYRDPMCMDEDEEEEPLATDGH